MRDVRRSGRPRTKPLPELPTATPVWLRLRGERVDQFEGFVLYRDQGCSVADVSEQMDIKLGTLLRWSSEQAWPERRAAYEAECDVRHDQAMARERRVAAQQQARTAARLAEATTAQAEATVAALSPKDAQTAALGWQRERREALGIGRNPGVNGPITNVAVQVNMADLDARVSEERARLVAALEHVGLTPEQRLRLAEAFRDGASAQSSVRFVQGETA